MRGKRMVPAIMCLMLILMSLSAYAADTYENSKSFSDKVLPETSGNTTLASVSGKTTSRSYGKVKITKYTNCSAINTWLRTKTADGVYHYWTPYIVKISDKSYHKVKYSNASANYYKKGIKADLRAENYKEALNIYTEKVSGTVYFN